MALSSPNVNTYDGVPASNAGCFARYARFGLSSLPRGVTVSTSASDLTSSASGNAPVCYFNHRLSIAWRSFRDSLGSCGFNITQSGSNRAYRGRIHVQTIDYTSETSTTPIRPASSQFYDIVLKVQNDVTAGTGGNSGKEVPCELAIAPWSQSPA